MLTVNSIDLLPCIYLSISYNETSNTFKYIHTNSYYTNLFNLDTLAFNDKDVGFLDTLELCTYSDISLLVYLNNLKKKKEYQNTISLIIKQNNITKTISDTISLFLLGREIDTNEFIIIGYKDSNNNVLALEPTSDRILDNLPIYLYWKDFTGKYLGSNNSIAPYLVVDEPVYTSLITDNLTSSYYKHCDNIVLNTKESLVNIIETHLIAPEGKRIHVRANKIPIIVHEFVVAILYTYEDITELIEQLNTLNETKELLKLKEQQYQELLDKVNNNNNLDTNYLFSSLLNKNNNNSEKELIQLELLLNKIEEQVKVLYEKVYTGDNNLVSDLAKLQQNQEEDLRNFASTRLRIDELDNKLTNKINTLDDQLDVLENSISFLLFFKNLSAKQILLFLLIISVVVGYVGNKLNSKFIKNIIDKVEKII